MPGQRVEASRVVPGQLVDGHVVAATSPVRVDAVNGYGASGFGKDLSTDALAGYTEVKHVMDDTTGDVRKDCHRTVFTGTPGQPTGAPAQEDQR